MDVFEALQELHKESAVDTTRRPLVPAEKNNGFTATRRSRTREVSSRYKSPTPSNINSRRCPSPNFTRNVNSSLPSSQSAPKRALSAERRRPSTPPSPSGSSTPVSDTSAESLLSAKKMISSRLPEVLWPSTMRSLSVSFQSDSISIPVSKKKEKEKPVTHALSDRTLKPSSNVAQKQAETAASLRKPTPERKRSPLRGKNLSHQSENSRPVDSSHARLIDQHRWPSRAGAKLSSSSMTRSVDLTDRIGKVSSSSIPSIGTPSLRRLSADGIPRPLHKTSSDASQQSSFDDHIGGLGLRMKSVDDSLLRISARHRGSGLSSSEKATSPACSVRSGSLPGSRLPSPSRASISKATPSPSKTRPSTPIQSRGTSPSRIRPSSPTRQPTSTTSVLSFLADIKKGKKNNQLEEAHQLRLLYNRHLQWRFANARAEGALYIQKLTVEQTLYNVWETNLELWDSVIRKRVDLQQLNLDIKLNTVLSEQMAYLEDWALLERDHATSLNGAIKDLEACTLRLPVTGGAKADIDSLKAAVSSAVDVMQAMGSSVCSVLSKVEGINGLVSELSELAGQGRALLNESEALLASTSAMQVKEYSLRTQLIQSQEDSKKTRQPLLWAT
ncbi:AUGMIN subunit 8 [Beta vulgaris subsp. vulgaris]|uniref:AUGMIN subunit 8 n=1 Tax=Beta vulgaris subsp. vulgaris TaxID=3555 RepID=UPI0020372F63|nr:AUGMIN subunit 8 [Beta vulgaris subsp. vulgaris]XP_010687626.2 AUGMIN subunit 8 [Beta vulgaris subsp. vulgaris]XP_010687627.2 AUGMIN subunit 8 [Beta vulgaris subsp. vulgaris]